jgi:hypothetical protein
MKMIIIKYPWIVIKRNFIPLSVALAGFICNLGCFHLPLDGKLIIQNNMNYNISGYWNYNWPDTSLGYPLLQNDVPDSQSEHAYLTGTNSWIGEVARDKVLTFRFFDSKYDNSNPDTIMNHIIKRVFATKEYLDSLNWVITVP